MKNYRLTLKAVHELEKILDYLEHRSPRAAKRVLDELFEGMNKIARTPGLGHRREDLTDLDVWFHGVYSYLIVYDSRTRPVRILHVVRASQDVERILGDE